MIDRERTRGPAWSFAELMLTVFGVIATFLGLFIMFGSETSSIGLGGELSWEVGEISSAWMYGLLIVGGGMLVGALAMFLAGRSRTKAGSSQRSDLVIHAAIFSIVNMFVWIQDFAIDDGLDYAHLVTIPWAIGLLLQLWTYLASGRRRRRDEAVTTPADALEREELQHH